MSRGLGDVYKRQQLTHVDLTAARPWNFLRFKDAETEIPQQSAGEG